jgi:hypothetical protein
MDKMIIWLTSDIPNWHYSPTFLIIGTLFVASGSAIILVIADSNSTIGQAFGPEVKPSLAQRLRGWWRSLSRAKKLYAILAAVCGIGAIVAAATGAGITALGLVLGYVGIVAALLPPDRPTRIIGGQGKRITCVYVHYRAICPNSDRQVS